MLWTRTLIPTQREEPKDAEAVSHKLLIRGGYIRQLASGIYSYLPLGARVLQKVTGILQEEMFKAGAEVCFMPALHPVELWQKTGRYEAMGDEKLVLKNRSGHEFMLGPTHEEVITEIAAAYIKSHRDMPKTLFQIQTKFRDEPRPRFGIIRTKEFIMKDAYSFDRDEAGLDESFNTMYEAYKQIYKRCGLEFVIVGADPGMMGGKVSQEFMVRSKYGEDVIVQCPKCDYTASRTIAGRSLAKQEAAEEKGPIESFDTPNLRTIEEMCSRFKLKSEDLVKTILYVGDGEPIACLVRGDHEVNEAKLTRQCGLKTLEPANVEQIREWTGAPVGFAGPVGLKGVKIVVDHDVVPLGGFVVGANEQDKHLRNVKLGRDFEAAAVGDVRNVEEGDACPECATVMRKDQAMEIGHVFKLGTRYSEVLGVRFAAESGEKQTAVMGCYGIGANRILAAHIEQHHDKRGMIWSRELAPYDVLVICVNQAHLESQETAESVYNDLKANGYDTLYDNRDERAGVKFNDADLTGIPIQVIIGERNLKEGKIEIGRRQDGQKELVDRADLISRLEEVSREIY